MSETETGVHKAVNAVMAEMKAIGKNSRNSSQNFNYRSIDDILKAVKPLFSKHGLFFYPSAVISHQRVEYPTRSGGKQFSTQITVEYTLAAKDGSFLKAVVPAEGMDMGDKGTTKAMTFAEKTFLTQLLCIPADEDPDGMQPEEVVAQKQWQVDLDRAAATGGAEAVEATLYQWEQNQIAKDGNKLPSYVQTYGNQLIARIRSGKTA